MCLLFFVWFPLAGGALFYVHFAVQSFRVCASHDCELDVKMDENHQGDCGQFSLLWKALRAIVNCLLGTPGFLFFRGPDS